MATAAEAAIEIALIVAPSVASRVMAPTVEVTLGDGVRDERLDSCADLVVRERDADRERDRPDTRDRGRDRDRAGEGRDRRGVQRGERDVVGADPRRRDAGGVVAVDRGLDEGRDAVVDGDARSRWPRGRGRPPAPIATEPAKTRALICSPAIAVMLRSPPAPIVERWT